MNTTIGLLGLVGTWAVACAGIWTLADRAEKAVTHDARLALQVWLTTGDIAKPGTSWASSFQAAFDAVFGTRHLSVACFLRSCIASLITVVLMFCVWAFVRPQRFYEFLQRLGVDHIAVLTLSNLLPDYVSLWKSRKIIGAIGSVKKGFVSIGFLSLDLIVTTVIACSIPALIILAVADTDLAESLRVYLPFMVTTGFTLNPPNPGSGRLTVGVFVYSTYFTSVWVWIHVVSLGMLRAGERLRWWSERFRYVVDLHKPFQAVGFMGIMLVTIVHLIAVPFVLLR